jgi:uncharacterized protein
MSEPFTVPACLGCGEALWPPRPVCPRCGATEFATLDAGAGVVEEATTHAGVALVSVRCAAGPVVIARLAGGDAAAGEAVELRREVAPRGGRRVVAVAAPAAP